MSEAIPLPSPPGPPDPRRVDQCVLLRNVGWSVYEALVERRGEDPGPRMTYLRGDLEIMSPSVDHEAIAAMFGRLIEAYADEVGIDINAFGSWTLKNAAGGQGLEPDRCYSTGRDRPEMPDLAIEVVWTSAAVDKLDVYRGIAVREVWIWRDGRTTIHVLRGDRYQPAARSEVLKDLDVELLTSFVTRSDQSPAVREFRAQFARRPG